jgi:chemotaxis response regulator CheB
MNLGTLGMRALKSQVVLVNDQAMLRHDLQLLIDFQPHMEIFGQAGDGERHRPSSRKTSIRMLF